MNAAALEAYLKKELATYEPKAIAWAKKADGVLVFLRDNKTAQEIETYIPGHEKILAAIEKVIPVADLIAKDLPFVGYALEAYDVYVAFGGKPKDWGAPLAHGEHDYLQENIDATQR